MMGDLYLAGGFIEAPVLEGVVDLARGGPCTVRDTPVAGMSSHECVCVCIPTLESANGSPRVISSSRQWFSKVEIASCCAFE